MYSLDINFLKDPSRGGVVDEPRGTRRKVPVNERMVMYAGVAAGLLPLALVGGFWLLQNSETGTLEQKLADLKAKNAASNAKLAQIKTIEKEADEMSKQAQGLATVFDQLKPWSAMLQDIRDRIPAGVQLTCIAQTVPASSSSTITNCSAVQPASSSSSSSTTTSTGMPATDTVVISGLTYNFNSINDFMLTLQQSPFFMGKETKLITAELKDYPAQWQRSQRGTQANSGQQPKLRKVVEFTIQTSLSDTPASKMLRELDRKGALGLVTRIQTLQQKGVLKDGLR